LHRVFSTEKVLTGVTQSRPCWRDWSVSVNPNPRGLTMPPATMATRRGFCSADFIMVF